MTFTNVKLYRYTCPLESPLKLKSGLLEARSGTVIKAIDGQNKAYFAESAPLPGFSTESSQTALNELETAGAKLLQPLDLLPKLCPSNQFAIHCLCQQFDATFTEVKICKYVHGSFDEMLNEIKRNSDATRIKIKLGGFEANKCAKFFKEACSLVSNYSRFRIDFNQSFDLDMINQFCNAVDCEKIDYIEEPTQNPFDLRKIKHPVKFALDESIRIYPLEKLLQIPNIKACVIKPMLDMVILKDDRFIEAVNKRKLEFIFSSTYESNLGLAHITKLAKWYSPSNFHGLDTSKLFDRSPIRNDLKLDPELTELIYETDIRSFQSCTR
ncbi:MAG: o-succinylbenzoate synthase [Chlamydiia bacterium]|nr:o-succinylbenzoate synthase [Chlamydiia bacterium]